MSYLDETVPADSEAVTLGASRIRQLKVDLDLLIEQIFEDAGTFLPGWIKANGAAGGASLFTAGAIQSADIAPGAVGTPQLAEESITGPILAPGVVDPSKLSDGFVAPADSVATSSCQSGFLSANPAGQALMANGFILPAMMGFPFAQVAIGSYVGSNSVSAVVNTLAFEPKIIILVSSTNHGIGVAFLSEAVSGISPAHASWVNSAIASPYISTIQWQSNGFIVIPTNFEFNQSGTTVTYFALAF